LTFGHFGKRYRIKRPAFEDEDDDDYEDDTPLRGSRPLRCRLPIHSRIA
jgi:hypothetical protein